MRVVNSSPAEKASDAEPPVDRFESPMPLTDARSPADVFALSPFRERLRRSQSMSASPAAPGRRLLTPSFKPRLLDHDGDLPLPPRELVRSAELPLPSRSSFDAASPPAFSTPQKSVTTPPPVTPAARPQHLA